jgi:glucose-1-phosphate cytidylyltransferase
MNDVTAILLCGGRGERLRPLTDSVPKVLTTIDGRPLLHHLMAALAGSGIERFVVCVGYMAGVVKRFVAEIAEPSWTVTCVDSGAEASITDRLADAFECVPGRALVCYGDTLANVDLHRLFEWHVERNALATITVYPLHSPFGIVRFDSANRVTGFDEKPVLPHWINIGYLLCERRVFDHLKPESDFSELLTDLAGTGELYTFAHAGRHVTINTEHDRLVAESRGIEFFTLHDHDL